MGKMELINVQIVDKIRPKITYRITSLSNNWRFERQSHAFLPMFRQISEIIDIVLLPEKTLFNVIRGRNGLGVWPLVDGFLLVCRKLISNLELRRPASVVAVDDKQGTGFRFRGDAAVNWGLFVGGVAVKQSEMAPVVCVPAF